ncbi:MAG: acyltransferase [Oscillospiraceae bacterium]|jgi:surface polysaccharide O-acyltransferase-like enzyme|nr:acyltransferase [Oscillospiraceae bacterium]
MQALQSPGKPRQSNIELLRIASFVMIAAMHSVGWYRHVNTVIGDLNWIFANTLSGIAQGAVGCFMLITGYFYESVNIKAKVRKILLPVLAYLPLYYLYLLVRDYELRSYVQPLKQLVQNLLNNGGMVGIFWYIQCLLIVTLLSPLLKAAIDNISRRTHLLGIAVMLVFFSLLPTVNAATDLYIFQQGLYSSEAATFVTMYFIGAYFRKYPVRMKTGTAGLLAAASALAVPAMNALWCSRWSPFMLFHKGLEYPFDTYVGPFLDSRNLLLIAESVAVFVFFTKLGFSSRAVNKTASLTYGAYLIHMFYVYLTNFFVLHFGWNPPYIPGLAARWLACAALSLLTEYVRQRAVALIRRPRSETA